MTSRTLRRLLIVAAVGQNHQRLTQIAGLLHLFHGHLQAVEQRRPPEWFHSLDMAQDIVRSGGERHRQFGPVRDLYQEEFVPRIRRLKERLRGGRRAVHLAAHTAAAIVNQSNGRGCVIQREMRNGLRNAVFGNPKVGARKVGDDGSHRVGNVCGYEDESRIDANIGSAWRVARGGFRADRGQDRMGAFLKREAGGAEKKNHGGSRPE